KLRLVIAELGMSGLGGVAFAHWAITRILARQRCGNDQHFCQALLVAGGQYHAGNARIDRQASKFAPGTGELIALVDRPKLVQQMVAVSDRPARWPVNEGKSLDVLQLERLHAQYHGR